jgi:hypothetical protein
MMALAILLALPSGCTSTGIEDAAPSMSATPQAAQPAGPQRGTASASKQTSGTAAAAAEPAGPKNTGTYPNLNVPPQVANDQITDDEKTAQTSSLRATQQSTAAGAANLGKGVADPVLLRKLAAGHADEALKKIQAQQ